MKSIKNWVNRKLAILSIAFSNVEKTAFAQNTDALGPQIGKHTDKDMGTLMHSLKNMVMTQEVLDLRWRTYKVLKATSNVNAEITGYDTDGMPIIKLNKTNKTRGLRKVKIDTVDDYPLEMVIDNSEIVIGGNDSMDNESIKLLDSIVVNHDKDGNAESATHGTISGDDYFATHKTQLPIRIERTNLPTFEIEKYTKKLYVRKINETDRLLEFHVSQYPDEYFRTSRLFISEIKKLIENPRASILLDFDTVGFITDKSIGVEDYLEYKYEIISFDKIIVFNGHYVIKFIGKPIINGKDILDGYKQSDLEERYRTKEKK
jgi:hypothetical protein